MDRPPGGKKDGDSREKEKPKNPAKADTPEEKQSPDKSDQSQQRKRRHRRNASGATSTADPPSEAGDPNAVGGSSPNVGAFSQQRKQTLPSLDPTSHKVDDDFKRIQLQAEAILKQSTAKLLEGFIATTVDKGPLANLYSALGNKNPYAGSNWVVRTPPKLPPLPEDSRVPEIPSLPDVPHVPENPIPKVGHPAAKSSPATKEGAIAKEGVIAKDSPVKKVSPAAKGSPAKACPVAKGSPVVKGSSVAKCSPDAKCSHAAKGSPLTKSIPSITVSVAPVMSIASPSKTIPRKISPRKISPRKTSPRKTPRVKAKPHAKAKIPEISLIPDNLRVPEIPHYPDLPSIQQSTRVIDQETEDYLAGKIWNYTACRFSNAELSSKTLSLDKVPIDAASIQALHRLEQNYCESFSEELSRILRWKYINTIKVIDTKTNAIELLVLIFKDASEAIRNREVDGPGMTFAIKFLHSSGCKSFDDLVEVMQAHVSFRLNLRIYFFRRDCAALKKTPEWINRASIKQHSENIVKSAETTPQKEPELLNNPMPDASKDDSKPFLGDSDVLPKEKRVQFQADGAENVENLKQKGSDNGRSDSNNLDKSEEPNSQHTAESQAKASSAENSQTPVTSDAWVGDSVRFYHELDRIILELKANNQHDQVSIMEGIKHNFLLADLIFVTITPLANSEDVSENSTLAQAFPGLQVGATGATAFPDPIPDLSVDTDAGINRLIIQVDDGTSLSCVRSEDGGLIVSDVTPSDSEQTWQSSIREYYKRKQMLRPITDRLTPKQTTKLSVQLCPHCRRRYRWPLLLHCFHILCFPCVKKLFKNGKNGFKCPICELLHVLPVEFGPHSLKIDTTLAMEMFEANLSPFCCTLCDSVEDATKFCHNCQEYLCADCILYHDTNPLAFEHVLEDSNITVGAKPTGELGSMCTNHPGHLITKCCSTCSTSICDICCTKEHNSHDVRALDDEEMNQRAKERFETIQSSIAAIADANQTILMNLNQSRQTLDTNYRNERRAINEYSNFLQEQVEVMKKRAKDSVETAFQNLSVQADEAYSKMETFYKKLQNFRTYVSNYNKSDTQGVMTMYPHIRKKYLELLQFYESHPDLKQPLTFDIVFDPKYPEITNFIHDEFRSLRAEYTCFLRHMLKSQVVRERHHVEPYKPLPYSLDYRFDCDVAARQAAEEQEAATGANSDPTTESNRMNFSRSVISYSRAFGQYGRGEYTFAEPSGILYLHDLSLAVCDSRNHRIVVYYADGTYQRTIGQPHQIPDLPENSDEPDRSFQRIDGKLYFPYRMAQCPLSRQIVVIERPPSPAILVFTFDGEFVKSFGHTCLSNPRGITVDDRGLILVLESKTMNFFIFNQMGDLMHRSVLGTLEFPNDVTARRGIIYISDNRQHCIQCFDYELNFMRSLGNESLTYYPIGVGFNHNGHLIITDNHNTFNITIFDSAGVFLHGYKSRMKHANCYNVALHPTRSELAVTTKDCQVLTFRYDDLYKDGGASGR